MKRDSNNLAGLTMLLCALLFMYCTQRVIAQAEVLAAQAEALASKTEVLPAQTDVLPAQAGMLTLTKGKVMAILDTFSGRFAAAGEDGKSLLFLSGTRPTSHISVAIDGTIWTNYGKAQMSAPYPQRNLGSGRAELLTDRLRYTWEVRAGGGTVRIIEELEPVSDSLYDEVRIHLIVEHLGQRTINAGMSVMEDVDANGNDDVILRQLVTQYPRERSFTGAEIPERLVMMSDAFAPDSGHCRFLGQALSAPDIVTVGRWYYHSGLGTAVYGYIASGQPISDAAVLLQWNSHAILPGGRREEVTAIGFTAPPPEDERNSTFANELIIPMLTNRVILSIVCDTIATVVVSVPYTDAIYEGSATRNGTWDTTLTVSPMLPVSVEIYLSTGFDRKTLDSITYYRSWFAYLRSDVEISAIIRPQVLYFNFDAATVWPVSAWDTEYLFHGVLEACSALTQDGGSMNSISVSPTMEYFGQVYTPQYPSYFPACKQILYDLPQNGSFRFQRANGSYPSFNHWNPIKFSERDSSFDGAGDRICGSHPFSLLVQTYSKILPGRPRGEMWYTPTWEHRTMFQPARTQLGTEYVFVPFRKPGTMPLPDFIRIIAYEDDTQLTLTDSSTPLRLDRQDHVDTLLDMPTIIRATKPVAVFQHHLSWGYLQTDTTFYGGSFALFPHGLWGKRYYSVEPDASMLPARWPYQNPSDNTGLRYDNLYLILIARAKQLDGITINSVPVGPSSFTVFEDWAYAYIDIQPGYHIVEGEYPLLTISCGGGHGPLGKALQSFGVSYIPPFR